MEETKITTNEELNKKADFTVNLIIFLVDEGSSEAGKESLIKMLL